VAHFKEYPSVTDDITNDAAYSDLQLPDRIQGINYSSVEVKIECCTYLVMCSKMDGLDHASLVLLLQLIFVVHILYTGFLYLERYFIIYLERFSMSTCI